MEIGKLLFRSFAESLCGVFCLYAFCMVFFPIVAFDPKVTTIEDVRETARIGFFLWYCVILAAHLHQTYKMRLMQREYTVICSWGTFFFGVPFLMYLFFWAIPILVSLLILISVISLAGYQHRVTEMKSGRVHA